MNCKESKSVKKLAQLNCLGVVVRPTIQVQVLTHTNLVSCYLKNKIYVAQLTGQNKVHCQETQNMIFVPYLSNILITLAWK
jgi:hypothetical protein